MVTTLGSFNVRQGWATVFTMEPDEANSLPASESREKFKKLLKALKMAEAMFVEILENLQHSMRLFSKSRSYTYFFDVPKNTVNT
jgi:hypothetical protein